MELFLIILLCLIVLALAIVIFRMKAAAAELRRLLRDFVGGRTDSRPEPTGIKALDRLGRDLVNYAETTRERLDSAEQGRQRMEAILRGMSDGVLIVDLRGRVVLANRTFRKLFRIAEKIEGRQILEVLRNAELLGLFKRAMDTWEILTEEISVSRADRDIHLIATAVPVYSGESVSGTVITLHDVTRLKQLEQMRKDFVANVSHEIKTPITAIRGFAETLLDGAMADRENATRFLEMIRNHSERLNNLVDDLLTLSRIELGDVEVAKAEVRLEEVVDTTFAMLKDKAGTKGLYLRKKLPEDAVTVGADRNRLIQILLNLIDNGIKFTEKGGVTVGAERSDAVTTIYVEDTGIGVPHEHLPRLGERFYRVDRARSRELGGTGLGLAIVKHLVLAHGWEMQVESTAGRGTRVKLLTH